VVVPRVVVVVERIVLCKVVK